MTIAARDFARGDEVIEQSGDFRSWHIASFRCAAEFGRYRGIADMAGLAAGLTRPRMTQMRPGRMEGGGARRCRAGLETSNAFSAAYGSGTVPVHLGFRLN